MSNLSIHLYLVSNYLTWTFLSGNRIVFTLHWLVCSTLWKNPTRILPRILWLASLLEQNPWITFTLWCNWWKCNSVLCITSFLVTDNSSCLWNLFASPTYNLCNHTSLSSNSLMILAASTDKPKSSLSLSASYPLLSEIVNSCLFLSLCFE